MALKFSTGLRNQVLGTKSLAEALTNYVVRIYTSPIPSSPNDAVTGTLLCQTSSISWGNPVDGTIDISSPVEGTNVAAGSAAYFRICATGDNGDADASKVRVQGTVGISGADMRVNSTNFAINADTKITSIAITIPAIAAQ